MVGEEARASVWTSQCHVDEPIEIESGQLIVDKSRTWHAVLMAAFIATNHDYFLKHIIYGDKQAFFFAFASTHTPYSLVAKAPLGVGTVMYTSSDPLYFISNVMAQRHPVTGRVMFLHHGGKFPWPHQFALDTYEWTHVSRQSLKTAWHFGPDPGTFHPVGDDVTVHEARLSVCGRC